MDPGLEEASRLHGAGLLETWRRITWPALKRPLLRSAILSFLGSIASFGVPAMLGAPSGIQVFTTAIYSLSKQADAKSLAEAGLLSTGMAALALVLSWGLLRLKDPPVLTKKNSQHSKWLILRVPALWSVGLWSFFFIGTGLPSVGLVVSSFLADPSDFSSWTLQNWQRVLFQLTGLRDALWNSVVFSSAATIIILLVTMVLSFGSARNRLFQVCDIAVFMFYSLPGSVIALAFIYIAVTQGAASSGAVILVTAYTFKFSLLSQNTLTPAIRGMDPSWLESARLAGAGTLARWRFIWLPLLKPALFSAALLVFMSCFSELTMSVLLYGPGDESIGVYLFQLQEYADRSAASVLAVLLGTGLMCGQIVVRKFTHA
jgi:iron(III) transport system permease protein